jgi:hypothetical protein
MALLVSMLVGEGHAQDGDGSAWAAAGGAALGVYSGSLLGLLGSLTPCSQTYAGARCVRIATVAAGAVGLASGALLGAAGGDRLGDHAKTAGYGVLIGTAAGLAMKPLVQRFGWQDVATVAALGGAIGTSAKGAGIGFAAGSLVGLILWQLIPGFELPDAFATVFAGLAVGGIGALTGEALDRPTSDAPTFQLVAPVAVQF